jgi:hypothetical protein
MLMGDVGAAIREYAELALMRRRGMLAQEDRGRIDELEDEIRDRIDGAHPAPRRIDGPSAVSSSRNTLGPRTTPPSANAAVRRSPGSEPLPPVKANIADVAARIELSSKDKKKVNEISETELPDSKYTAPIQPAFLEDYYGADLSIDNALGGARATRAVGAAGADPALSEEARLFFGIGIAAEARAAEPAVVARPSGGAGAPRVAPRIQAAPAASATPAPAVSAAAPEAASAGPSRDGKPRVPCIVHLLAGGFKRGECPGFDPESGFIQMRPNAEHEDAPVPLEEVLAIFFATAKGAQPRPQQGQRLVIRLVNDREIIGTSSDYEPGAQSLTLVPDERRGNVDRVWIPAWSVKAIELD